MNNYDKLIKILTELFQLDQADLDFGIYRIMNQKREEILTFLNKDLLPQVKEILQSSLSSDQEDVQQELNKLIETLKSAGINPDDSPKVKELKSKLGGAVNLQAVENEVFSHLAGFFKRYYHNGDFISLRRYKKDVYAIPYEGEEVKLHWANHDQYYIKSSEYLKNYAFKLADGKKVNFVLKEANTEQNNNKAQNNQERRFSLYSEEPFEVQDDTLNIHFTYDLQDKKVKQSDLLSDAIESIRENLPAGFTGLLEAKPTEKNKQRTLLEKHLVDYTSRNTFDYFIHKDLGGFLSRELDFYIKNEVLFIDDLNTRNEKDFINQLSLIKAIKNIGAKVITFLAQLENFQKKLWLKKKFVVETNYCITLDKIPEEYYSEIASNETQLEEWIKLFSIDEIKQDTVTIGFSKPLSIDFLKANPFLVLDTKFFSEEFKEKLLSEFENLDEEINGLMINSDNFQALGVLDEKYNEQLSGIYIDPPYNTDASAILYKNDYKNSSWISLMENRLRRAHGLLRKSGVLCVAIDDEEVANLVLLLNSMFERELGIAPVRSNPAGRKTKGTLAPAHEYALFYGKSNKAIPGSLELTDKRLARYPNQDDKGRFAWANFIRSGTNDRRRDRPKMFYPIVVCPDKTIRIPDLKWNSSKNAYDILETVNENETLIYPITNEGIEKRWQRGYERVSQELNEYRVSENEALGYSIHFKTYMDVSSMPVTWWDKKDYASANYGAAELKALFKENPFDFPKARKLVEDCIRVINGNQGSAICLDFFAGSGTTGHAILELNRADNNNRKYILVEMGEYFDKITKPRIQKVIYSNDWKEGKPVSRNGISQMMKYHVLESYEDALNNLTLQRNEQQNGIFKQGGAFAESYMLSYLLDVETEGSLLNTNAFVNPFDYRLVITRNNEAKETKVDLVETFNYLIGLHVETIERIKDFKVVTGRNNDGEKILVIWRNLNEKSNKELDEFFLKQSYNTRDTEFDRIYVNGDNNLENLKVGDETWKVALIEEEFKKRMFDTKDV